MQFVITGNGARLTAERQRWQLADNQFQRGTHGTPWHHMAAEHNPVGIRYREMQMLAGQFKRAV